MPGPMRSVEDFVSAVRDKEAQRGMPAEIIRVPAPSATAPAPKIEPTPGLLVTHEPPMGLDYALAEKKLVFPSTDWAATSEQANRATLPTYAWAVEPAVNLRYGRDVPEPPDVQARALEYPQQYREMMKEMPRPEAARKRMAEKGLPKPEVYTKLSTSERALLALPTEASYEPPSELPLKGKEALAPTGPIESERVVYYGSGSNSRVERAYKNPPVDVSKDVEFQRWFTNLNHQRDMAGQKKISLQEPSYDLYALYKSGWTPDKDFALRGGSLPLSYARELRYPTEGVLPLNAEDARINDSNSIARYGRVPSLGREGDISANLPFGSDRIPYYKPEHDYVKGGIKEKSYPGFRRDK